MDVGPYPHPSLLGVTGRLHRHAGPWALVTDEHRRGSGTRHISLGHPPPHPRVFPPAGTVDFLCLLRTSEANTMIPLHSSSPLLQERCKERTTAYTAALPRRLCIWGGSWGKGSLLPRREDGSYLQFSGCRELCVPTEPHPQTLTDAMCFGGLKIVFDKGDSGGQGG